MIGAEAFAKVNLGLRVGSRSDDGFHPIEGVFQSVRIADRLVLAAAEQDTVTSPSGSPVIDGMDNLAFRAAAAVRKRVASRQPLAITLEKSIPAAAGLGGGSADAAAGLALAGRFFGVDDTLLVGLAAELGSDVPFCLRGGTARVTGRGDLVEPLDPLSGFSLAIAVPPVEIATPAAFRKWDELGEPAGLRMSLSMLPPALRSQGDLYNDLYPASVALAPELDDWRGELERAWGRPVMLSGSGPSLYGFFVDCDEANGAAAAAPIGTRFAEACELVPRGWRFTEDT